MSPTTYLINPINFILCMTFILYFQVLIQHPKCSFILSFKLLLSPPLLTQRFSSSFFAHPLHKFQPVQHTSVNPLNWNTFATTPLSFMINLPHTTYCPHTVQTQSITLMAKSYLSNFLLYDP